MTALPELQDSALDKPPAARKVSKSLVHDEPFSSKFATSLYRHLDVSDLFEAFATHLCRTFDLRTVCFENPGQGIHLTRRQGAPVACESAAARSGFMLRHAVDFEGEALGTLIIGRDHQFLSREIRQAKRFVDLLRGPLRNALEYRRVWQSAYHDALTGARNRASLDLLLSGAERGAPVRSMLVCDVDSFKSINDRYGHAVGDTVLTEFAGILTAIAGKAGTVYRYGGDEFVIVFRQSRADGGYQIAERIRESVMAHRMVSDTDSIRVTTTIGLTQVRPGEALDETFLRADSALLLGKRQTKNVVVSL